MRKRCRGSLGRAAISFEDSQHRTKRQDVAMAIEGSHPFYNDNGLVVVFSVNGTSLTKVAEARVGKWNQGVVWSRDGKTLLAQSMAENSLSILSFDGKTLGVTGEIKVKGGPAGLRTAER
jgi:hypothetical protein